MSLSNNLTLSILSKAEKEGYGILAQACYDASSAIGLVRAAERTKSPAILQLFPISLEYGGLAYLRFCVELAHAASVPIAVHLDHATTAEALELAIGFAEKHGVKFDSIMVDASHADTEEENIAIAKPFIDRCKKQGISTEVELGRLEGGEAGVREITGEMLTDPSKAEVFMRETGADILAPCVGNRHGSYKSFGGPAWRFDLLETLGSQFKGRIPIWSANRDPLPVCIRISAHPSAHGTDELPEEYWPKMIGLGVTKINVNSWCRDPYAAALSKGLASKPFPEAQEEATEVMARECEKWIKLFGSAGKA